MKMGVLKKRSLEFTDDNSTVPRKAAWYVEIPYLRVRVMEDLDHAQCTQHVSNELPIIM